MVTKRNYNRDRRDKFTSKFSTNNFILLFSVALIFAFGQNAFAQGSTIETDTYKKPTKKAAKKTTKKLVPKKTKTTSKKASVKKAKPRKPTVRKAARKRPVRRNSRRNKSRRAKNAVKVVFNTEAPGQEIWRGNEKIGVSDDNAKLEKWMSKGNYLVSVRNSNGETILNSKLISISNTNKEFHLVASPIEDKSNSNEQTAEETIETQLSESLDAAERINDILKRYGDPMKTNTVTLSDWEFVYQSAQANNLKKFTAIQIEAQRWFATGQIELAKGNHKNAYKAFSQAAEFMPDSAYPYYALGEAYNGNRRFREALTEYRKATRLNPKFALAHRKIGDIQAGSKRHKEAIISYETALANGFDTPAVRFDLAKTYMSTKRWTDASRELESIVKEAPTGDVYETLGDLYNELKRNISAYEAYKKSTEISPNSARAFYKLGDILFSEREYEKAKIAFETALELDKSGKEINISQARKFIRESAQKIK